LSSWTVKQRSAAFGSKKAGVEFINKRPQEMELAAA
jgi:hypothetical protein